MAVALKNHTRVTSADALTEATYIAGLWEDIGGAGATLEDNFFYQGSYSVAEQVKTSEFGTCFIPNSQTYNASNSAYAFLLKGLVSTSGLLATTRAAGQKFEIGSGATAGSGQPSTYWQWYVNTKTTYPATGSWVIIALDPSLTAFIDSTTGSPSISAINYWGHVATMTSTSVKAPNVAFDAIDFVTPGGGLIWTSTGGDFQDFIDYDEGTTGNRYGFVTTKGGVLYVVAMLTIGSATATTFTDANKKLIFPWTYVGPGVQGLYFDLQNASTSVSLSVCSFTGNGQYATKRFFDTALQVNGSTEVITLPSHGLSTGDYVTYSKEGGSHAIGMTDTSSYWVYVISTDTFAVHSTRSNAYADTSRVNLTAGSAPGENHSIIRTPDNRIDFTVSGTSGALSMSSCIVEGVRVMTLTSATTIDGGFIQNTGSIVPSTATLTDVVISSATTAEGVALLTPVTSTANIARCEFVSSGRGHAMELTSATSYDSNAIKYTSYWQPTVSGSDYGWQFHTITGVASNTITTNAAHGFTTGDAVYYNKHGGSDTIGLTDLAKYYVNVTGTTTFTVHRTKAAAVAGSSTITLSDGSTGETHSIYSANAAIYNNSGGSCTINVLNLGDTPSVRNGSGATTSVVNTKTLKITCLNTSGLAVSGVRIRIEKESDGSLISEGSTNSSGIYQDTSYAYTADVYTTIIARLKGYKFASANEYITVNGMTVPFTMVRDPAVNLP